MKKFAILLLVVLSSALGFAQSIDDLGRIGGAILGSAEAKREKDSLKGQAAKYNAAQPNLDLDRQTVEVRAPRDWGRWGQEQRSWIRASLSAALTRVGAAPVWNTPEILGEAEERDALSGNRWVNQRSLPGEGTIEAARLLFEFEFIEFDRSQAFQAWWGSWWRGGDISFRRETAYFGLTVSVRDRSTGAVLAVYKTLGTASDADNAGARLSGFFGSQVGVRMSEEEGYDGRQARAMENALAEMAKVIAAKCG